MRCGRNQFHFIFHAAAYSQSVIETYLVNCLETDNNNNDNQTSVQGLLFCPVSTCVTLFSFSLLSQSHHIPSTYSATVPHPSYTCCLVKSTRRMNISYIGVFCSFIWKYPCTLYFYLKISFVAICCTFIWKYPFVTILLCRKLVSTTATKGFIYKQKASTHL